MKKTPQVTPDWDTGIYIGGTVAVEPDKNKKVDRAKWFDDHIMVSGPDKETETKIARTLRDKITKR